MRKNYELARPRRASSSGACPSAERAGTATSSRQDVGDARAEQREEVRVLCPVSGNSAVPLYMHARAALPPDALLTHSGAFVS